MKTVRDVVKKFGTMSALGRLLDVDASLISYWIKAGTIPAKWHNTLLQLAEQQGIELKPEDIIFIGNKEITECSGIQEANVATEIVRVPVAKWSGTLTIGDMDVPCYVLDSGDRVISRGAASEVISGKPGGMFERYVGVSSLGGYVPANLEDSFIEFQIDNVTNKVVKGMSAEVFLDICKGFVNAYRDGVLTEAQQQNALRCILFLSSCAKVGLIALIDEATGYQYARAEDALQVKLRAFLSEEMRAWEKTFPDELWKEFGRLTNWKGATSQRPKYWGKLVMELVYDYLDKDVSDWLKQNAPQPKYGQNYHQWLSSQYGLQKLIQHIWMVVGMAKTCQTIFELKEKMAVAYGRKPVQYVLYLPPPSD